MNQKLMAVLAAVIAVIVVASVFLLNMTIPTGHTEEQMPQPQPPESVALGYEGEIVTVRDFSGAYMTVTFQSNGTLFDCKATLSYQSTDNTTMHINQELGLVDRTNKTTSFELSDYPTDNISNRIEFSDTNPLSTVQITAYGYTTPNPIK